MGRVRRPQVVERVISRRLDPVTGKIYSIKHKMPEDPAVAARLIQRADDTEEAVRTRLSTFHKNLSALRMAFPSMVLMDGNRPPGAVFGDVCSVLDK